MSDTKEVVERKEDLQERRPEVPVVTPAVDIYENNDEILLCADMPGVEKDDIRVNIDNGKLSLSGVRQMEASGAASWEEFGAVEFHRVFSVPQTIDMDKVNAELKDGVLRLHLPKSEAVKPKQIEIKTV